MLSLDSRTGFDVLTRYNRQVDSGPGRDVECRDVVSGTRESTLHTLELISGWSVLGGSMPALEAELRSPSRIYHHNDNPCQSRFILNKLAQMIE